MAFTIAGMQNGFFPALTGQVVSHIRKPESFRLNKYIQYVESKRTIGVYAKINRNVGVSLDNLNKQFWRDGAEHPSTSSNKINFTTEDFVTKRYSEGWEVGFQADEQFEVFNLKPANIRMCTSLIMTQLTKRIADVLTTAGNWDGNVEAANVLNGGRGFWHDASSEESSASYNAIYETIMAAAEVIHKGTNGTVGMNDLMLVFNPNTARRMASSGEIRGYIKGTPDSKAWMEDPGNMNRLWGLPPRYASLPLVVEDAVYVTDRPKTSGAESTSRNYVFPDNVAVLMSRIGGLDGDLGTQNYSTCQVFWYGKPVQKAGGEVQGQMVVSAESDTWNQMLKGRCTIQTAEELAAPASGYMIQNLFS